MVMPINPYLKPVTVVDDGTTLPFQLVLHHGVGRNKREIIIDRLTTNPKRLHHLIYEIEEFVPLKLMLTSEKAQDVSIQWGASQRLATDDVSFTYTLNSHHRVVDLYQVTDDKGYPWRCGIYPFEIVYDGKYYYGGFKVNPKNVTEAQIQDIYELVNSALKGLAIDYVNQQKTIGSINHIVEQKDWSFIQRFIQLKSKFFHALKRIEKDSQYELKTKYVVENIPKYLDQRSFRWENNAKGQSYQGAKYLNRKLSLHWDSPINRQVKHQLIQLVNKIEVALDFIRPIKRDDERAFEEVKRDISHLEESKRKISASPLTTDREKRRLNHTLLSKKYDLANIEERLERHRNYEKHLSSGLLQLEGHLTSNFWREIERANVQQSILGHGVGYAFFNDLWNQLMGSTFHSGDNPIELPIYKPSSELYEYYVFFGIIHLLQQLNFQPKYEMIAEQLMRTFYEDGLKDGTQVKLVQDNVQIHLTYDEMIDHNAQIAHENGRNFYSRGNHRKPDIRLDLYKFVNDQWQYASSFIVEVKYRPFYNIYTSYGKTGTMDQLAEYWSIKYVQTAGNYVHNAVQKVVCIYPGAENVATKFSSEDGLFLQFYPDANSTDIYDIVGKTELKSLLSQWIF